MIFMDEKVFSRVLEHYNEAHQYFDPLNIVFLGLQGSQNYSLDTPFSDVDTKLVVTPSLSDIIMNRPAVSTTHIRANEEHIDFKDIRLMFNTFRKQNLNFLEILFTEYYITNPLYKEEWDELRANAERIAHYNLYAAVKAMKGIALEKYHAMEHPYPSKLDVLAKYQYDPKQLHHLVRVEAYLRRYIGGASYDECLHLDQKMRDYLIDIKLGKYDITLARKIANATLVYIDHFTAPFTKESEYNKNDPYVDELLDHIQERIMTKSIKAELKKSESMKEGDL